MNFFKNTWKTMFNQSKNGKKQQSNMMEVQQMSIPEDILNDLFQMSSKYMKETKEQISNDKKLQLYGFYKQATEGNCTTEKPALYDIVGKSKWEAWKKMDGVSKQKAMQMYVVRTSQLDKTIQEKIEKEIYGGEEIVVQKKKQTEGIGFKKVEAVDYSDQYSHPYFKKIEKGEDIEQISHEQLLKTNNQPTVYPLHFAIDKQRTDLVEKFIQILSIQQIESLKDPQGTTILQYAQLIENQEILGMIKQKLQI